MKKKRAFLPAVILCLVLTALFLPNTVLAATPSAPTGLEATPVSSSEIDLDWDDVDGATSYLVYMSTSSSGTYTSIASDITESAYTADELSAQTTYYFKVKAHNDDGTSAYSAVAFAKTEDPSGEPAVPENLDANALSSSEIKLTWDAAEDAVSYYIYRATSATGTYSRIASNVKITSYTNTGLAADRTYYYKVSAYNTFGGSGNESAKSDYASATTESEVTAKPPVPTNLTAAASSSSEIDLDWDESDGATSYLVYRSTSSSGTYTNIATVATLTYTATELCADTTYYFKVQARNSKGTSAYSAVVTAKTDLPSGLPAVPTNLDAEAVNSDEIRLTWDFAEDAVSYYIYRATSATGTYSRIATNVKITSYTNSGLSADRRYYYKVSAYNNFGGSGNESAKSAYAYATTESEAPDEPEDLDAEALSSSRIELTWDSVSEADEYYVYRSRTSSGTYTKIETVEDESFTDTGLTANTTYYYKVKAHNDEGTSGYSNRASATTERSGTSEEVRNTYRLAGADRYATAAEIAENGWTSSDYAVIASGENFPDALCGAPLAAEHEAPILLTSRYRLEEQTRTQLRRLDVENVFLIGGTGVISSSVEDQIEDMGIDVTRIAGSDRYETALLVAQELDSFDQAIIVTGDNFPDALSIAPIAGMKGYPILLTEKYSLPTGLLSYLNREVDDTIVVGGTGVVSTNVYNQLPSPLRLSGDDRYATNLAVIRYFEDSLDFGTSYVATGKNYPDALAGSALAAREKAPLLLVSDSVSSSVLNYLEDQSIDNFAAFGGTGAISTAVLSTLGRSTTGDATDIPDVPEGLTAAAVSSSEIELEWESVDDADGYYVYRATSSSGNYVKIATVDEAEYTDDDLDADRTYYYKVKAYNSYGTSDYSNRDYDTTEDEEEELDAPEDLEADAISDSEIELTWDSVRDADEYYVYRATTATGTYRRIAIVDDTEYTDEDLDADRTYYYKVRAHNDDGTSDYSNRASATTED